MCAIIDEPTTLTAQHAALVASALPMVVVIAVDPSGWFPFTVARWWAAAVWALVTVAVTLWTTTRRQATSTPDRVAIVLVWPLLAITFVSTLNSIDGVYAWIGTPMRHLGLVAWVFGAAMFAVGRRVADDARLVARGLAAAGLFVGVYCLVELAWKAPIGYISNSERLGGPFGSASYLGAAACLLLPAALGTACDTAEVLVWRTVAGTASGLLAIAVIGSGSRAALVGLVTAATIVLIVRRRVSGRANMAVLAGVIVVSVAGLVATTRTGVFVRTVGWSSRLDEWRLGLRAIADRPLLGTGPEGYRLVVDRFVDADYVRRYGEVVGIDRAHSGILDVAIASGVIAAAVYLALLGVIGWSAVRLIRHANTLDVGLAATVVAYGVQQQLLFPLAELDPICWLLAGLLVVRSGPPSMTSATPSRRQRAIAAAVAIAIVGVAIVGVRAVAADRVARSATRSTSAMAAFSSAQRATELASYDSRFWLLLARTEEQQRSLTGVDHAIEAVDRALDLAPLEPITRRERARLLALRAAITGTDGDRIEAATAWSAVIAAAPNCATCRLGAASAALERGDIDEARSQLVVAVDLGSDNAQRLLAQIGEN